MSNVICWRRAMELGPIYMAQGNYRLLCYYYLVDVVPIDGQHFTHFAELLVVALGYEADLWATARSLKDYTSGMSSSKEFLDECGAFAKAKMQIYTRIGSHLALLNEAKRLIQAEGLCTIAEIDWRMSLLPTPYKVNLAEIWKNVTNGNQVRKNYCHLQEFYTIVEKSAAKLILADDPSKPFTTQSVHDPAKGRKIINRVVKRPTINSSSSSTPQVPPNEPPRVVNVLKPYQHLAVEAYLQLHNHLYQPGGLNLGKSSPILFQPNRGHPARIQPQEQTRTTNSLMAEHSQRQPAVQQKDKAVVADTQWQQKYFPIPPPVSTSTFVEPVRPNTILNTIWAISPPDTEIFQAGRVAPQPPLPVVPPHLLREPEINPLVFPGANTAPPPDFNPQVTVREVPPRRFSVPRVAGQGSSTIVSPESTRTIASTTGWSSKVARPKLTLRKTRLNFTRRGRRSNPNTTTTNSNPVVAQPDSMQTNPAQRYTATRYCQPSVPLAWRINFYQGKMHWRQVNKPKLDQEDVPITESSL